METEETCNLKGTFFTIITDGFIDHRQTSVKDNCSLFRNSLLQMLIKVEDGLTVSLNICDGKMLKQVKQLIGKKENERIKREKSHHGTEILRRKMEG